MSSTFSSSEPRVRIGGKTFLYKQKAPFVASGVSIQGAIEYDAEEDKLRCHECGEWFLSVGIHAAHTHGISAREYKLRHGLRISTALVSEQTRSFYSDNAKARMEEKRRVFDQGRKGRDRTQCGPLKRPRYEGRNERGTCAAQLLAKIKALSSKLGHTPSSADLGAAGISKNSAFELLGVKDLRSLMTMVGLVPNETGSRRYSAELVVEMLRNLYTRLGRLPRRTDFNRGVAPSAETIYRVFGSLPAAYKAAGLGLVARKAGRP